ncbi:MAG TPA: hypothetical protein VFS15_05815 [Kofleriaceae bacterium]|nr:hypothetical protein [Kofleriaceae bacterium]
MRSSVPRLVAILATLVACGGTPRVDPRPVAPAPAPAPPPPETGHLQELEKPAPVKLVDIDWSTTPLDSDADALAAWQRIAPTGADWSDRLDELPDEGDVTAKLALALLRGGNFTCVQPPAPGSCAHAVDVPEPAPAATLADPCLRRLLAIWAISQLEPDQVDQVRDALRAIAAIPPPESELVSAALQALPESDQDGRLELYAIAFRAGHRELVNGLVNVLDEAHLITAVRTHHIDGALDLMTAVSQRSLFLAALADEQLNGAARVQVISELADVDDSDKLAPDVRAALVRATKSPDCAVAAAADRFLVRSGAKRFAPARPRTHSPAAMMRALCVLASYEAGLRADEPSFLPAYVPKKGLELVTRTYDEYSDVDTDGDGDPHTESTSVFVPREEVVLPEVEDMIRAFANCAGTTCRSVDREFRFGFKGGELLLTRLEVNERPPCK